MGPEAVTDEDFSGLFLEKKPFFFSGLGLYEFLSSVGFLRMKNDNAMVLQY